MSGAKLRIAVVGGGLSGLVSARLLEGRGSVTVYEASTRAGGMLRCEERAEGLFHCCGGHVFNTHRSEVSSWFWGRFDKESEWMRGERRAVIDMRGHSRRGDGFVGYPLEDHLWELDAATQERVVGELLSLVVGGEEGDFEEYLLRHFGETLCGLYFRPYNAKVWGRSVSGMPMSWLSGKLPKLDVGEMLLHNIRREEERRFVHSTYWYPRCGGSGFTIARLSAGLSLRCGHRVERIEREGGCWLVDGEQYDRVVYTGLASELPGILRGLELGGLSKGLSMLPSHDTTTVFCLVDANPYTWIYLPGAEHGCHRIIVTGNLSASNNGAGAGGRVTASAEWTGVVSEQRVMEELPLLPLHPTYVGIHYQRSSYPIQCSDTRELIGAAQRLLNPMQMYLVGRGAEWEYYNQDAVVASALSRLSK